MIVRKEDVVAKLNSYDWKYATADQDALAELKKRIAVAGKNRKMIKYSELVSGVRFCLPNVNNGAPYQIRTWDWHGFDRALIGEFLGYISMESYINADFMASAIVVSALDEEPSGIFFDWMKDLGLITGVGEDAKLAFWADQVDRAQKFYTENA